MLESPMLERQARAEIPSAGATPVGAGRIELPTPTVSR